MMEIGIIGWRGMVGSVLLERMRAERDFDLVEPIFFSTSQAGAASPDIGRRGGKVQDAHDLKALARLKRQFPGIDFWMEPGRFLVAKSGVLVAQVTQLKSKGDVRYVGIATGMNSLIRPALYGAHHDIRNLTRLAEPSSQKVTIVGPICETADLLGSDRWLPPTEEGDVLVIANCGAYGYAMASHYNLRPPATEWVIDA